MEVVVCENGPFFRSSHRQPLFRWGQQNETMGRITIVEGPLTWD
jgi:hypothetical protein